MRELVLIIVVLSALKSIQPIYTFRTPALQTHLDCAISNAGGAAKPIIIQCRFTPTDNGYVDNLFPTKSFGGSNVLIVQNVPSVPVAKTYAFLKFNILSDLPSGLLQSRATPENASLQMYVRLMNFFYNATVEIHDASGNWTENTLTWNTMPQLDPNNYVSLNIMQNGTWALWNVTPLIQPLSNSSAQISFAAISSESNWKNLIWFDSDEYPFANGTTSPTLELTFVEPYLTIETPFPRIPISVGENTFLTDTSGRVKLLIPWGEYIITVPDTIPIANGTRAKFTNWSDRTNSSSRVLPVGNNITLRANYGTQHDVTVSSPFGTVSGGGWYFENAQATISINPTAVPVNGLEGWFGARDVFDHWTGACTALTPQCSILVNRAQNAEAVWRVDWSQTIVGGSTLIVSVTLLTLLSKRRRRRGSTKARLSRTSHTRRVRRTQYSESSSSGRKIGTQIAFGG